MQYLRPPLGVAVLGAVPQPHTKCRCAESSTSGPRVVSLWWVQYLSPPLEAAAPRCVPAVAAAMGEAEAGVGVVERPEPPPGEEPVLWSPEVEVCLFHAMLGHKPVGVNRHFHMICIRDKFSQNIGRQISSKVIWEHLRTMYDMQALLVQTQAKHRELSHFNSEITWSRLALMPLTEQLL
ncbi:hypothetical protein FKM82_007600 [Ascaphus truei]